MLPQMYVAHLENRCNNDIRSSGWPTIGSQDLFCFLIYLTVLRSLLPCAGSSYLTKDQTQAPCVGSIEL